MEFKIVAKTKISQLPKNPGVYAFKKGDILLYIGKAANIKERVKNHFPSEAKPSEGGRRKQSFFDLPSRSEIKEASLFSTFAPLRAELGERRMNILRTPSDNEGERRMNILRTQQPTFRDNLFINQVKKVGFIKTNSEIEALILEANLIKKYQPKYNIVWRDDKNYFFVGITKETFPTVFITHRASSHGSEGKEKDQILFALPNTKFIGPFVDGKALKHALKILRKVFPYRTCKTLPTRKAGTRPCLWYQLNRCPAPCLFTSTLGKEIVRGSTSINRNEYRRNIKNLIKVLQGKKSQVVKDLKKEMKIASENQDFEKAAEIRDQIDSLEKVLAHGKIFEPKLEILTSWGEIKKTLQKILNTKKGILRIEAYDISNIQGKEAAGSMVTFIKGLPDKNFYRHFKIKIADKPNDIAMIREILSRRFNHPEWPLPDLILIDGGRAQLNAAKSVVKSPLFENSKIKVIAIAKKKNELYIEEKKKPLLLKNLPREIFNLILQLRDEAHRFAISYHHKLRTKALIPK